MKILEEYLRVINDNIIAFMFVLFMSLFVIFTLVELIKFLYKKIKNK